MIERQEPMRKCHTFILACLRMNIFQLRIAQDRSGKEFINVKVWARKLVCRTNHAEKKQHDPLVMLFPHGSLEVFWRK
jgi:hypothetical protein